MPKAKPKPNASPDFNEARLAEDRRRVPRILIVRVTGSGPDPSEETKHPTQT
jgi:hypothetical protein